MMISHFWFSIQLVNVYYKLLESHFLAVSCFQIYLSIYFIVCRGSRNLACLELDLEELGDSFRRLLEMRIKKNYVNCFLLANIFINLFYSLSGLKKFTPLGVGLGGT